MSRRIARTWLIGIAAAAALSCAQAQDFPSKNVTIVVPFGPGGPLDVEARLLAPHFEKAWSRPVLVENRPGAGARIGTDAVVKAAPDGHTMLFATAALTVFKVLIKDLGFDPLKDLAPISMLLNFPTGLVTNTKIPVNNVDEFVAYAKANPGKLFAASYGRDSSFLMIEAFKRATGIQMSDIVYSGVAQATTALIRNDIQLINGTLNLALKSQVDAGTQRPLLLIGSRRASVFPGVPTAAEKGWNVPSNAWVALLAPAGTPKPVIDKIAGEIANYVASPATQKRAQENAIQMTSSTPEQLRQLMEADTKAWTETAAAVGLKPE